MCSLSAIATDPGPRVAAAPLTRLNTIRAVVEPVPDGGDEEVQVRVQLVLRQVHIIARSEFDYSEDENNGVPGVIGPHAFRILCGRHSAPLTVVAARCEARRPRSSRAGTWSQKPI
jgi:hypothetical protein